ncbi:ABC transporter ATP-binding protein [Anaerorhabdus furcosa]|uniref:Energy-coupling factor transport system ATP-binding protein n=1 Tax=Anaerorhabdus furcosa TaxID=118967 RepID=A0A1T4K5M8_9FIRM|nr:ABC transporter ATP-binding protein [Anaerorhabdus furcosa]SJZ37750.1 energy-coupling factor transport system ATP-binding protein [Anaerorhabdus furcosa]
MRQPVIQFKDFTFQYYSQAEPTLHNINLTIHSGEKILIVGPSGSGKSTLGHCLNGLIPFSYKGEIQGSLLIHDSETKTQTLFDLSKQIGTVLQDSDGQFVGLTVGEDIAFALENDNVPLPAMKDRVKKIAQLVSMDELLGSNPFELSGGQKQRVSLAGVLVDDVDILLFDEPLANLDPATGKTAIELIDDIHDEGKTVVIIEHRLEDVLHRNIDRIIVMNEGRILMDDTPNNVLSSNILLEQGIREPLYITACKYAGIKITPDMNPEHISTFNIDAVANQLQSWFKTHNRTLPTPKEKSLLEINHLSFSYDGSRKILEDINLIINEGEMISIVGKNGAGKSTLSKLIVGFEKEDKGSILLEGQDLVNYTIKERAEHVGIVLQNPNQMISKNLIYDEIALGLRIRNINEEEIEKRVLDVMKICGLLPFKSWPISALSYGQKKRVTIACILVLNPKILILDEPTAGQDYHHYSEIMEFLESLNKNGQTIILITHDMHLMLEYTPRAIVLANGKKLADTKAYEVLCDPVLIQEANLKETSLFELAQKAHISDPLKFVECFIIQERRERNHES